MSNNTEIKLTKSDIEAIESVLSKGDRTTVIPLKNGGVRVKEDNSKTVYVRENK